MEPLEKIKNIVEQIEVKQIGLMNLTIEQIEYLYDLSKSVLDAEWPEKREWNQATGREGHIATDSFNHGVDACRLAMARDKAEHKETEILYHEMCLKNQELDLKYHKLLEEKLEMEERLEGLEKVIDNVIEDEYARRQWDMKYTLRNCIITAIKNHLEGEKK